MPCSLFFPNGVLMLCHTHQFPILCTMCCLMTLWKWVIVYGRIGLFSFTPYSVQIVLRLPAHSWSISNILCVCVCAYVESVCFGDLCIWQACLWYYSIDERTTFTNREWTNTKEKNIIIIYFSRAMTETTYTYTEFIPQYMTRFVFLAWTKFYSDCMKNSESMRTNA